MAAIERADWATTDRLDDNQLLEHLDYITQCDASSQLDMNKSTDRKTLMKMFRISQLTIHYLLKKTDTMEENNKQLNGTLSVYMDKYSQVSFYYTNYR